MNRETLMGIDIGTHSTRAALLDLDGRVIASASTPQEMQTPRPGWAEQDPQVGWDNAAANIKRTIDRAEIEAKANATNRDSGAANRDSGATRGACP